MRTPKYTDSHKYQNGYRRSAETNVARTFARVREEQKRIAEEADAKVAPLKRAAK